MAVDSWFIRASLAGHPRRVYVGGFGQGPVGGLVLVASVDSNLLLGGVHRGDSCVALCVADRKSYRRQEDGVDELMA